jgi:hypothetical protein
MAMDKLTVFAAKRVRTMDAGRPVAGAVAIADDKIVSVETLETMRPWLDRLDHEIDETFKDKVIFPGFIDPHTHFRMSGVFMGLTYIGPIDQQGPRGFNQGIATREGVLAKLKEADAALDDPARPILAWGLDPAVQGGQLHRDELDGVSKTRPIWTVTYAPHVVVCNSPMLEVAGVDESTNVYGVERYGDGRLNGQFIERALAKTAQQACITTTAEMIFDYSSPAPNTNPSSCERLNNV